MDEMKISQIMALTMLAFLSLSSGGLIVSHAAYPATQPISLNIAGGVVSAGDQQYSLQQGGEIVAGVIQGNNVVAASSNFEYHYNAQVYGLSAIGYVYFNLQGTVSGGTYNGWTVDYSGSAQINGAVPAVCLPSYSVTGVCATTDTSMVPAFFLGVVNTQLTFSSPGTNSVTTQSEVPMMFESAYLNPFGAPVVLTSIDGSIVIITTYSQATINWSNVIESGTISGNLGSTSVNGQFSEISQEQENLVTGTAQDQGQMTFSGMNLASLDSSGTYSGSSTIPTAGSYDISAAIGFPPGSGVATATGFQSIGTFDLRSQSSTLTGSYSISWGVPAFEFEGSATAWLSTR